MDRQMSNKNNDDEYCIMLDAEECSMDWMQGTGDGAGLPSAGLLENISSPSSKLEEGEILDEERGTVNDGVIFEDLSSDEEDKEAASEVDGNKDEDEVENEEEDMECGKNNEYEQSSEDDFDLEVVDEWHDNTEDQTGGQDNQPHASGSFNPSDFYHLGDPVMQRVRRFGTQGETRQFSLRNLENCPNLYEHMDEIFDDALGKIFDKTPAEALIGATYSHPELDEPISVHFRARSTMTGQTIVEQFERVLQSNQEIDLEDPNAVIRIVTVVPPSGVGNHNRHKYLVHHDSLNRAHGGCFIRINNQDNLCLARAVVVAEAMLNKHDPAYRWNTIRTGSPGPRSFQTQKARDLMARAGLQHHTGDRSLRELRMTQDVMPNYRIKVFSKEMYCAMIFEGKNSDAKEVIRLYHHDNHFTVMRSMAAFFTRGYWCEDCNIAYNDKNDHRCINRCSSCYHRPPCMEGKVIHCEACNRFFHNKQCYQNHSRKYEQGWQGQKRTSASRTNPSNTNQGVSVCDRIKKCVQCCKQVRRAHTNEHRCGYFKCRTCDEEVIQEGHLCYMKNIDQDKDELHTGLEDSVAVNVDQSVDIDNENVNENDDMKEDADENNIEIVPRFAFFDFETTQERVLRETKFGEELMHVPNLCIARTICDDCRNRDFYTECGRCGPERQIFKGEGCVKSFCRYLFGPKMKNTIAIARNAKGFDAHFVLQYLYGEGVAPKVVTKGLQIISLSVGSIKIIDSFSFLPMALAALPKAFGIEEAAKGFFPHLFNKVENWDNVGPWPEAFYYAPTSMKPSTYASFGQWYRKQIGKVFNFQEELIEYCDSDVDVLLKACMKFRDLFMAETTVDPFAKSLTIAGACNRVFRKLFLKPKTIGLVPQNGYRGRDMQSAKAILGLDWISKKNNIVIQHAKNGLEAWAGPYKIDGKCGNTAYEFNGCYWHGCPKCVTDRNKMIANGTVTTREAYL